MKQVLSFAACASTLAFVAAPAWGQVSDAAFITQVESVGNTAFIEQVDSQGNNYVSIDQTAAGYSSGDNRAQVMQLNVGDSTVRLNQSGQGNDYTVTQYHGRNLMAFVDTRAVWDGGPGGEFNTVLIEQSGLDASAFVDNGFGSNHNRVEVTQQGFGGLNQVDIVQYNTTSNLATVFQAGSNLTASIVQSGGGGNVATIRQGQRY